MKAPIAQRRVTGARPMPGRRRPRGARPPLRHPLALLYRQSGKVRPAAPATVRAADGRAVPLAPRLQIALNLALTLNEHHHALMISAAPSDTAPVMRAAAPERASTTRRSDSAGHLTRAETGYRMPAGARAAPPFGHTSARGNAAHASGHDRLVHARSGSRGFAHPSSGRPGAETGRPAADAGVPPPWPLSQKRGAGGAAATVRNVPGDARLPFTRLGNPPAVVRYGRADLALRLIERGTRLIFDDHGLIRAGAGRERAEVRPAPDDPVPDRNILAAGRQRAGEPVGVAAAGSRGSRPQARSIKSRSDVPPRARRGAGQPAADVRLRSPASRADRDGERPPPPAPAERRAGTDGDALQSGAAAPAGYPLQRPGQSASRSISRRLPGVMAFASVQRPGRIGPPRAADRLFTASRAPAARGIPAPLYLAERHGGRSTAPAAFGSVWAPPPLDFRSAGAPPAPLPPAEARPAATTAPAVAPVDLEAVSRDVISRIEKRLRVERERRGRS
jgi:hypothetical protein